MEKRILEECRDLLELIKEVRSEFRSMCTEMKARYSTLDVHVKSPHNVPPPVSTAPERFELSNSTVDSEMVDHGRALGGGLPVVEVSTYHENPQDVRGRGSDAKAAIPRAVSVQSLSAFAPQAIINPTGSSGSIDVQERKSNDILQEFIQFEDIGPAESSSSLIVQEKESTNSIEKATKSEELQLFQEKSLSTGQQSLNISKDMVLSTQQVDEQTSIKDEIGRDPEQEEKQVALKVVKSTTFESLLVGLQNSRNKQCVCEQDKQTSLNGTEKETLMVQQKVVPQMTDSVINCPFRSVASVDYMPTPNCLKIHQLGSQGSREFRNDKDFPVNARWQLETKGFSQETLNSSQAKFEEFHKGENYVHVHNFVLNIPKTPLDKNQKWQINVHTYHYGRMDEARYISQWQPHLCLPEATGSIEHCPVPCPGQVRCKLFRVNPADGLGRWPRGPITHFGRVPQQLTSKFVRIVACQVAG